MYVSDYVPTGGTMSEYKLYVKVGCPYCSQAMLDLQKAGITYSTVVVSYEKQVELSATSGITTVPQLFNGTEFIGDSVQIREKLLTL
jgi:glutaredoxin